MAGPLPQAPAPLTRGQKTALAVIVTAGLAARGFLLAYALGSPGFSWEDPDGYALQARRLAGPDGWRWTFDAVTYTITNQRHALPPGYSVFLSAFALFPGFPLTAQIAQIALGGAAIWLVFLLGRRLHSARAGLIGAAGYALWIPGIFNVWSTSQETLYIPLVLAALVLLGRAIDRDSRPLFALSGVIFGLAALTRSMPLFFVVPAAAAIALLMPDRRRAAAGGVAFLLGFLLLTAPYTAALSRHFGQLTVIDTHGSIHLDTARAARSPGLGDTLRGLWHEVAANPAAYATDSLIRARSLLHVNGGRLLQIYVVAGSRTRAAAWKALVHLGADALLIASAILAAIGAALCRNGRLALLLLLWTAVNVAIASLGGFGGARLRAPFEPFLLVLAAVVLAGGWRRPHPAALVLALAAAAVAAAAVLPQVQTSLRAWPDYGVRWPSIFSRTSGAFTGAAGLNVPAFDGVGVLTLRVGDAAAPDIEVRVGGAHVRTVRVTPQQPAIIRATWPARGLAFVELQASSHAVVHVDVGGK